jgi:hypothetical protein
MGATTMEAQATERTALLESASAGICTVTLLPSVIDVLSPTLAR